MLTHCPDMASYVGVAVQLAPHPGAVQAQRRRRTCAVVAEHASGGGRPPAVGHRSRADTRVRIADVRQVSLLRASNP